MVYTGRTIGKVELVLFSRSFRIIQFLNRQHGWLLRALFAVLGFLAVLISTGKLALARFTASEFWSASFKPAGRRVGWYLRTGWMRWHIAHDPFFNFAENVPPEIVSIQQSFLKRAQKRLPKTSWHGDMMLIDAYWAHRALANDNASEFSTHLDAFSARATVFLNAEIETGASPATRPTEKAEFADFRNLAAETLSDFQAIMAETKWTWFVTGGTLLGAVRHGNFLDHDNDLDVGAFVSTQDAPKLVALFEENVTFTTAKMDIKTEIQRDETGNLFLHKEPALLKLVHSNGVNLDIFFHYDVGGKFVHGSGTMAWENTRFGFSNYQLGDMTVLGPDDADLYLTEHYGDWRVERKEFSCVTDTTNISYVQNLFTTAFHIRRLNFLKFTDPERAREIEFSLLNQGIVVKAGDMLALSSDLFPYKGAAKNCQRDTGVSHDNDDAFERWGGKTHRGESPQTVH